ncbi:MAG: C10 family peptidase, partial [Muribaculaceae bacterium]|nr:C10 family peptidase [Muribaculaceae bacterium]
MKKAFFIILLNALLAAPAAWSVALSPDEALARLSSESYRSPSFNKAGSTDFTLTETLENLYVFSGKTGFIVVPDDDCAPALLGYSDNSVFDADVNPNLAYWLEFLNGELDYLKENPQSVSAHAPRADRPAISPMIDTRWNQGSPYNNDCPVYNGYRSVTGCVATAMAQVLKYHNYPEQGSGVVSYIWNNQELSFDYGSTTFEWDLMTDTYDASSSAASMAAVAKLMYACGVSVNMNYSPQSSGASSSRIPGALIDNFNYDKGLWLAQRNAFGILEWEELIYNELKEGRPVIYSGQGSGGGHEFVCDGYAVDGYFHFNWGWGGLSDGYFLLTALNPGNLGTGGGAGGYNFAQDAVIGVMLPREDSEFTYIMYNIDNFTPKSETATLGSSAIFYGAFMNGGAETMPTFTPGVKFLNAEDNSITYASANYKCSNLPPSSYYSEMTVVLPDALAEGDYVVTPAFRIGAGDWQDMLSYTTITGSQIAKVEGSTVTFTAPERATVTVTDITTASEIYISR